MAGSGVSGTPAPASKVRSLPRVQLLRPPVTSIPIYIGHCMSSSSARLVAQYVYTMQRVGKIVPPKRQILKDISLSFFPGAKIGVLGLNGSGKSSLLKIMAGLDQEIEGEAIPMPDLRIGFLPQEPQLDPKQTVREAVEEGLGEVFEAKQKLQAIYAAYAEPDADFDKLAAEQAKYQAILPTRSHHNTH